MIWDWGLGVVKREDVRRENKSRRGGRGEKRREGDRLGDTRMQEKGWKEREKKTSRVIGDNEDPKIEIGKYK